MKYLLQFVLAVFAILTTACASHGAERFYDSDIAVYVRGGIKPGVLKNQDVWVSISPRIELQNAAMVVEFRADKGQGPKPFAIVSCAVGNLSPQMPGIAIAYGGAGDTTSCNPLAPTEPNTSDGQVIVPAGARITAAVRSVFPTRLYWILNESDNTLVPTSIRSGTTLPVTLKVQNKPSWTDCAESPIQPRPTGGRKRVQLHAYVFPIKEPKGILADQSICLSVTPIGTGLSAISVKGGLYGIKNNQEVFLGTFACTPDNFSENKSEGSTWYTADSSCNMTPNSGPKSGNSGLTYHGKMIVRLTASFSSTPGDTTFDQVDVPILPYPPKYRSH